MTKNTRSVRVIAWGIMLFALLLLFPAGAEAKIKAPKKECHAYCVMDAGSGKVLFGQDEDKVIYPASTAKLMTAIVCCENGDLKSKIKTEYDIVHGTIYGLYTIGIPSNTTFTFKDLLNISLITSAADATDSLAAGVFGSKKACVKAMNEKVAELGLKDTSFDNPDGSDIGAGFNETYSTAREMSLVTRYAMTIPAIRDAVSYRSYTTSNGIITGNTTNWLLRGYTYYDRSKYHVIGSKSGTTNAAGHVFIATAEDKEGHEVICAYFGNVSKESTFASIRSLFDYAFDNIKKGKIKLEKSNYDVRCSKDLADIFDLYAGLNCYPTGNSGLFKPNQAITRKEFGKLVRGVCSLQGNANLTRFAKGNSDGHFTVGRLARLVQDLYPTYMDEEEVTSILSDCTNVDDLSDQDKMAMAILVKNCLAVDSFKNANQIVTRKQALLFADKLNDYLMIYAADNPMLYGAEIEDGLLEFVTFEAPEAEEGSTEDDAAKTSEVNASTTTEASADMTADTTGEDPVATGLAEAQAGMEADPALEEVHHSIKLPAFLSMTTFNQKWLANLIYADEELTQTKLILNMDPTINNNEEAGTEQVSTETAADTGTAKKKGKKKKKKE